MAEGDPGGKVDRVEEAIGEGGMVAAALGLGDVL